MFQATSLINFILQDLICPWLYQDWAGVGSVFNSLVKLDFSFK